MAPLNDTGLCEMRQVSAGEGSPVAPRKIQVWDSCSGGLTKQQRALRQFLHSLLGCDVLLSDSCSVRADYGNCA